MNWKTSKFALRLAGLLVSVAATVFFLHKLQSGMAALSVGLDDAHSWLAVLAATGLVLPIYLLSSAGWKLLLALFGEVLPFARAFEITSVSQIYRYLPGNLAQHVGRVALAKEAGIETKRAVCSVLLEAACLVATGSLMALATGRVVYLAQLTAGSPRLYPVAAALAFLFVVAFAYVARRTCKSRQILVGATVPGAVVGCLLIQGVIFILHGSILLILFRHVFDVPSANLLTVTGVFALAWTAGYLTPGAPAGIGVREAVLMIGLVPICGEQTAAVCAGSLRLVSMLGDGLTFAVGVAVRQIRLRRSEPALAPVLRR